MDASVIISRLKSFFGWAEDTLVDETLTFAEAFIKDIISSGGNVLIDAARAGVSAAESVGGTGEVKYNGAFASVTSVLESEGIMLIPHAINAAIEAAVAEFRAKNPISKLE